MSIAKLGIRILNWQYNTIDHNHIFSTPKATVYINMTGHASWLKDFSTYSVWEAHNVTCFLLLLVHHIYFATDHILSKSFPSCLLQLVMTVLLPNALLLMDLLVVKTGSCIPPCKEVCLPAMVAHWILAVLGPPADLIVAPLLIIWLSSCLGIQSWNHGAPSWWAQSRALSPLLGWRLG